MNLSTGAPSASSFFLSQVENLVFQGGGVKGIAYVGCIEALISNHIRLKNIKRVGGASAGAITSLYIALGKSEHELKKLRDLQMDALLDEPDPNDKLSNKKLLLTTLSIPRKVGEENSKKPKWSVFLTLLLVRISKRLSHLEYEDYCNHLGLIARYTLKLLTGVVDKVVDSILGLLVKTIENTKETDELRHAETYTEEVWLDQEVSLKDYYDAFTKMIMGLPKSKGLFSGETLLNLFQDEIKAATGSKETTFKQFHEGIVQGKYEKSALMKDLYVVGLNLSTQMTDIFSYETTPDVQIAEAVRASMSIPVFFTPVAITGMEQFVYVDGGTLDNYPVWFFDKMKYVDPEYKHGTKPVVNERTLGFRLCSGKMKEIYEARFNDKKFEFSTNLTLNSDFSSIIENVFISIAGKEDSDHYHNVDGFRTIYVHNGGVSAVEFNLSDKRKDMLVQNGKDGVEDYFTRKNFYPKW